MTAARELLDRLAEIGATVSRVDDRLILRAGLQPVPAALVKRAHQAKNELALAILPLKAEAQFWQRRFVVLTSEWRAGNRDRDSAKRIAWENLANEWQPSQGRETGDFLNTEPVTTQSDVTGREAQKPPSDENCDGVTDSNTPFPEEAYSDLAPEQETAL